MNYRPLIRTTLESWVEHDFELQELCNEVLESNELFREYDEDYNEAIYSDCRAQALSILGQKDDEGRVWYHTIEEPPFVWFHRAKATEQEARAFHTWLLERINADQEAADLVRSFIDSKWGKRGKTSRSKAA